MSDIKNLIINLLFFIFIGNTCFSQNSSKKNSFEVKNQWFVSFDYGMQMSGIKSEDFISSNYSPMYRVVVGKWFNSNVGFQIGYQGRYFKTIANNNKHFYNFYFLEGILDVKNILSPNKKSNKFHELLFHGGVGFFQNEYYGNSSTHFVLGIANNFSVSKKIKIKFDIGAIVGWDIYQGNSDILPSLSLGLVYNFQ